MGFATSAVVVVEGGGACLLTVAVRLLGGTETACHVLECAYSALGSYSLSSGRLMQRCERTARVASREGVDGLCHTSAVVMAEGRDACLLTVAVRLLLGIETAQHVLE